jgi:hypothetical protein
MRPPVARGCIAAAAGLALIAFAAACGSGGGDSDGVRLEDLPTFAASSPVTGGTRLDERTIESKEDLSDLVIEAGLDKKWTGGYRAQYIDLSPGLQRLHVDIDVYESRSAAQERSDGEIRANDEFFKESLSPAVEVQEIPVDVDAACSGLSIKLELIVPQYEVFCRTGTVVVLVRAIGNDEDEAIAKASQIASDLTLAIDAALDEGS